MTSHTWEGGKSDDADLHAAADILRRHADPDAVILIEPYLLLDRDGAAPPRVVAGISRDDMAAAGLAGVIVRRPDVVLVQPDGRTPQLVIEIDGSYHDSVQGRKATDRRSRDYRRHEIACTVVNKSQYADDRDSPLDWRRILEAHLSTWNLRTPPCAAAKD